VPLLAYFASAECLCLAFAPHPSPPSSRPPACAPAGLPYKKGTCPNSGSMAFDAFPQPGSWQRAALQPLTSLRRRWVWVCSQVVPPIQRPLTYWCRVRQQHCGKHSSSPAEINCAPTCSRTVVVALQSIPRGMAGAWGWGTDWACECGERKSLVSDAYRISHTGCFACSANLTQTGYLYLYLSRSASGLLLAHCTHISVLLPRSSLGERRCSSNHSITAGSYRRDARTGAPASRLNMQTEQQKCNGRAGLSLQQ
jgi:hypothetical protein